MAVKCGGLHVVRECWHASRVKRRVCLDWPPAPARAAVTQTMGCSRGGSGLQADKDGEIAWVGMRLEERPGQGRRRLGDPVEEEHC